MTWPFPYDDPETLPGQLQRGLGRGFLAALDAPRSEVHAILLDCILHEARLDHQIDSRGWYYGELAYRTALPLDSLESHLRAAGEDEAGDGWPAVDVLGHLAIRGREDAADALRKYVEYGGWWEDALLELGRANRPELWSDLEDIAVARLAGDEPRVGVGSDAEPFATWSRTVPAFIAWREAYADSASERDSERKLLREYKTEQLLEPPLTGIRERAKILGGRSTLADQELLTRALRRDDRQVRGLATVALAEHGSTESFAVAKELLVSQRGWQGFIVRSFARTALVSMPASLALPLAREWRSSRRGTLRHAARVILDVHATNDDIPWIRRQLRRKCSIDSERELLSAAELAVRLWHPAMLVDLLRLFGEFRYSYGRGLLAGFLSKVDPAFSSGLAVKCLWDCEPDTRRLGVTHADRSNDLAAARIAEIAADSAEDEVVRIAARDALR